MELMEASVYVGDGALEVHDVPVPEPGPGEVLIEIAQCGICGTDLHFVLERIARPGSTLGHEWAGTIVALGDEVDDWEVGRRVVCGPEPGCGECRACRADRPSVCLRRPPTDHLSFRGAFARLRGGACRAARGRARSTSPRGPPPSPSRRRWRCTRSPCRR